MTLVIDTGTPQLSPLEYIPDWFRDICDGVSNERTVHDFAYHLMGAMNNPKTIDTVRKHILANWRFLAVLADMHPGVFDEFWTAYAERILSD